MAKRELIDRNHLLEEIKKLQKSPWYNLGKDNMVVSRALYNERKEAVEVVRDLCVNDESTITEQEIVKPYLEKLRAKIYEEIDFEEKWLNDVFWKDKGITLRDIEIAMNGIRHVVKGELEE